MFRIDVFSLWNTSNLEVWSLVFYTFMRRRTVRFSDIKYHVTCFIFTSNKVGNNKKLEIEFPKNKFLMLQN